MEAIHGVLLLGALLIVLFSTTIHKIDEGHVGVYYRVSLDWKS